MMAPDRRGGNRPLFGFGFQVARRSVPAPTKRKIGARFIFPPRAAFDNRIVSYSGTHRTIRREAHPNARAGGHTRARTHGTHGTRHGHRRQLSITQELVLRQAMHDEMQRLSRRMPPCAFASRTDVVRMSGRWIAVLSPSLWQASRLVDPGRQLGS